MSPRHAVTVRDLRKVFGRFVAVDDVSFDVREGEVFGFLGPNGAGKTTTIKMLTGLVLPSGGAGSVAGLDIMKETERIKTQIGYMSQLFSLYANLTVQENIALFAGLYGVARSKRAARRDWVLEMAGLTEMRDRLTGELSLGWKQRLALGCAVLHEPPILFLDEPTSGVDPISQAHVLGPDLLVHGEGNDRLRHHPLHGGSRVLPRLALMNRGRLIALDTPAALRAGLREPLLELRTSNSAAAVEVLEDVPWVIEAGMFGRTVHAIVRDEAEARAGVPAASRGVRHRGHGNRVDPALARGCVHLARPPRGRSSP